MNIMSGYGGKLTIEQGSNIQSAIEKMLTWLSSLAIYQYMKLESANEYQLVLHSTFPKPVLSRDQPLSAYNLKKSVSFLRVFGEFSH